MLILQIKSISSLNFYQHFLDKQCKCSIKIENTVRVLCSKMDKISNLFCFNTHSSNVQKIKQKIQQQLDCNENI